MSGYLVDTNNRDIILVGQVDPSYPPLYVEDFVVALRNVWAFYAQRKGHVYYYSPPGCSIDPDPKVLRELRDLGGGMPSSADQTKKQAFLDQWQAVGSQPQNVRVLGIPFNTRFAKVMVDADYYMKHLVDGSVTLDINGFESLMDMRIDMAKKRLDEGDYKGSEGRSMDRFWFCPGESTYAEESGIVLLKSCPVKLLTEQQFLTATGEVAGSGRADALAQQFADNFTDRYQEVAGIKPIYKELEGLFRFVGLARLMKDQRALAKATLDPRYLLAQYPIKNIPVDHTLPGIINVKTLSEERETSGGHVTTNMWHMSCGGVFMDVRPKRVASAHPAPSVPKSTAPTKSAAQAPPVSVKPTKSQPTAAHTSKLKKTVLEARKSSGSLYWDIPGID